MGTGGSLPGGSPLSNCQFGRPLGAHLEQQIWPGDGDFRQHYLALEQLQKIDHDLDPREVGTSTAMRFELNAAKR
jgi:hypothetical protein